MQQSRFLSEILSTLFDRRQAFSRDTDGRDIFTLCHALLSQEGEVSGHTLAETILTRYRSLSDEEKIGFFRFLNDQLDVDGNALATLAQSYSPAATATEYESLIAAAEPNRQELLRRLNQPIGATAVIVAMRTDLLRLTRDVPELARTDVDFVHLLSSWFNLGFLTLKQIDWDTPARILDKVVAYEAVHEIEDLDDLRRRLLPPDRRCFAFFHPAMPDEPLIFVEVALTVEVPNSIASLLSENRPPIDTDEARVAAFYSISNCQEGLAGISFGNLLIKQAVAELSKEFPKLKQFVTLSPLPHFNRWLETLKEESEDSEMSRSDLGGTATKEETRAAAARYLIHAKRPDGLPFDPVARFHLGNGAEIHDLHSNADTSERGIQQSSGVMVNYLYDPERIQRNHEAFVLRKEVVASRDLQALAKSGRATRLKEANI